MCKEFWIEYELKGGIAEWEGPYGSEVTADRVAYDLLASVSEAVGVTTYLRLFHVEEGVVEMIPLLVRRREVMHAEV